MFVLDVPSFSLDQSYNSKQVPRWIKLKESKYVAIHGNKSVKIEQQKTKIIMNCSEQDFYDIWFDYFDFKTDYFAVNNKIKRINNKIKVTANRSNGLHIINQDKFESYIYARIIEAVGYTKAIMAINHIAQFCGIKHVQSMKEAGKIVWYEFPNPELILKNFNNLQRMGKVNLMLWDICTAIIDEGYDINNYDGKLFRLFAMKDKNTFPINGIEIALENNFKCEPINFENEYLDDVSNKSLIYLYILNHIFNLPKSIKEVLSNGISR